MDDPGKSGRRWTLAIVAISVLTLAPGLGASRLSYHEAIVGQGAREMLASGDWLVPTIDGRPWLEKPPLLHWLVMLTGSIAGDVTELAARLPSALAAGLLALAVATLASRRFGATVGGLAGCIQATTSWTVIRGRLADADMLLACLIAWTIVALDRLRDETRPLQERQRFARLFWLALGATSLVKGIYFGAALILATTALILAMDRDRSTLKSLINVPGMALALLIILAWPALILSGHPKTLSLWTNHVADRLADRPETFAGQASWWAYVPAVLTLTLPWTPLAIVGAYHSYKRAVRDRRGPDRLLWAWAVGPIALLSLATIKNAHYAIHALAPWSVWAALGVARVGDWLEARGRSRPRMARRLVFAFTVLSLAIGLGFGIIAPRLDRRGVEWGFYQVAARSMGEGEPLVLLYDDWDRLPYPTPFGPVPHDLAVRLYYLRRPATWREGVGQWSGLPARTFVAIARDRDLDGLARVGRVEKLVQGPPARWDRTFALYRVSPGRAETVARSETSTVARSGLTPPRSGRVD
jgi:4-amino-4-deoxy-L-arabinose transferase-like glycosyltransferase